jgi:predicted PurR-regulated permease PerM
MDPLNTEAIHEILKLTKENNQMLHAMRRHAFLAGLFKLIVYIILFAAPIWFYMTYVSDSVDNLINALNKVQGTTSAAQAKFNSVEAAIKDVQSRLPAFMQPSTSSVPAAPAATP